MMSLRIVCLLLLTYLPYSFSTHDNLLIALKKAAGIYNDPAKVKRKPFYFYIAQTLNKSRGERHKINFYLVVLKIYYF